MRKVEFLTDRFLVTGGHGFLGSYVCGRLLECGVSEENVIVPTHAECDLTSGLAVSDIFEKMHPDVVIHLAAEVGGIGANQANPGRFFYSNMIMGLHVIEESRKHDVKKVVQVGTICAYPKYTPVPFDENDLWNGYPEETNAPYGIAKKSLLVMCQAYRQQYGLNAIYLLPVNLYGPNDNFDSNSSHVIPALIRKCVEAKYSGEETITCWGDGTSTREFLYVDDAAEGIVLAVEKYDDGYPVNLGNGNEISVLDLARKIADCVGFRGKIEWDTSKPNGQPRRCLSTKRASGLFGFNAKTSFDLGLGKTVDWYMEQLNEGCL